MYVEAKLKVYDTNADATDEKLCVRSHWNNNGVTGFVVLVTPKGETVTVSKCDMEKALSACTGLR